MEHHQNCRRFLDSLSDYVDGSLSAELCRELDRHMADCANCKIVVDTLKKTVYLYHETAAQPSIPSDVRVRLFRRLKLDDYLEK
ncbi:MAG: anti-sigma factor [Chloroflexi bacterium]|nr:anti-sigma factor [Chloroflexota bacterium]